MNRATILGHMGNAEASGHGSFFGYDPTSAAAAAVQNNGAHPGPAALIATEVLGGLADASFTQP